MLADAYQTKVRCTKCGAECYRLCYIATKHGDRVVCVDCFAKACDKAKAEGKS